MERLTELESKYNNLEQQSILDLLLWMNQEDQTVPQAIQHALPQIHKLIEALVLKVKQGGRLFYIGAGTSGRLGIIDASECPPTFGVSETLVNGIIAGGDHAIRKAVEFAEDDLKQGWIDLSAKSVNSCDFVIGIAASGTTPYVVSALETCRRHSIATGCITSNPGSAICNHADFPIEIHTGPEFITGSTRLKSGTAQKLVLNMISTILMIQLGRISGNRMVDMQLSNSKLIERGTRMLMKNTGINDYKEAEQLLLKHGSVRTATTFFFKSRP
jgi:N-acetylmuramic acid 6-phosphate etherase